MIKRVLGDIRRLLQTVDKRAPHWALVLLAAGAGTMFMELSNVVGLYGATGRAYSILVYVITAGAAVVVCGSVIQGARGRVGGSS
jgi:hypothetical protein